MFWVALVAWAASATTAAAESRPVAGKVDLRPGMGRVVADGELSAPPVLYLNRCKNGCVITPGFEDSRTNKSSIIDTTAFIPEYDYGDESWTAVVDCVRGMYADFGIAITDEDPGEDTEHFEAIVAGAPTDAGFSSRVGGVAPFSCGVIENSITYTFVRQYGNNPQQICQTIAQESAHAFGLDHELLCEDPMTYLTGCGSKCFQDTDAPCGEDVARRCSCGGQTQNSWQRLHELFGDGEGQAASLSISGPSDGDVVRPGFHVNVDVSVACIANVETHIDDMSIGTVPTWPYVFDSPVGLEPGPATIRAVATDNYGNTTETSIQVTVDAACERDEDCDGALVCAGGLCVVDDGGDDGGNACAEGSADCGEPQPEADCGCATGGGGGGDLGGLALLCAVVAGWLSRRRRTL